MLMMELLTPSHPVMPNVWYSLTEITRRWTIRASLASSLHNWHPSPYPYEGFLNVIDPISVVEQSRLSFWTKGLQGDRCFRITGAPPLTELSERFDSFLSVSTPFFDPLNFLPSSRKLIMRQAGVVVNYNTTQWDPLDDWKWQTTAFSVRDGCW